MKTVIIDDQEDVRRFEEYLRNPTPLSKEAIKLFKEALRIANPPKFDPPI